MRVLITGRGGFVGRVLETRLRARYPDAEILPALGDITQADAVEAAIAALRPTCCIHLAAIAAIGAARDDPDQAWQVNLHGTLSLARALTRHAPDALLIFASTSEAYGRSFAGGRPLDEGAALAPGNLYAATKAAADLALGAMGPEGPRVVRMRPFNHTGAGQAAGFVVPAFARQIVRIERGLQPPVIEVGNLAAERDLLDVRDICDAYIAAAAQPAPFGADAPIFNLCSGRTRSIRSVLDDLLRVSGVAATVRIDPARLRPVDIPRACGSAAAAHDTLGWAPRIAWDDTIADVLDDWRTRLARDPAA